MLPFFGFWHWKYAHISWFQEEGWKYISVDLFLFVLVYNTNFMNKHKFNDFDKKLKRKLFNDCSFFISTKSPHFQLRGTVDQLRKRKRVICWSTYIIRLCTWPLFPLYRPQGSQSDQQPGQEDRSEEVEEGGQGSAHRITI